MRKSILLLAAAAALASCTQSEVLEVAENRAISFDPFVGKATRAVTEIVDPSAEDGTKLTKFYVFGRYGESSGATYDKVVYTNAEVDVTSSHINVGPADNIQYWVPGKKYMFAAYSDGNNQIQTTESGATVSFGNDGHIKIENYQAGTNDLILATADKTTETSIQSDPGAVQLTFKHLLSQVKFKFDCTAFPTGYQLTISDLKIENVPNKATYSYVTSDYRWTGITTGNVGTLSFSNIAEFDKAQAQTSDANFVIPQTYTENVNSNLTATFKVTVKDNHGSNIVSDQPLTTTALLVSSGNVTQWQTGYRYQYNIKLTPENVGGMYPIKFTVTTVEGWQDKPDNGNGTDLSLASN